MRHERRKRAWKWKSALTRRLSYHRLVASPCTIATDPIINAIRSRILVEPALLPFREIPPISLLSTALPRHFRRQRSLTSRLIKRTRIIVMKFQGFNAERRSFFQYGEETRIELFSSFSSRADQDGNSIPCPRLRVRSAIQADRNRDIPRLSSPVVRVGASLAEAINVHIYIYIYICREEDKAAAPRFLRAETIRPALSDRGVT